MPPPALGAGEGAARVREKEGFGGAPGPGITKTKGRNVPAGQDDEQPRRKIPRPTDITPATARFVFSLGRIDRPLRTLCRIPSASNSN